MNKIRHNLTLVFLYFVSLGLITLAVPFVAGYRTLRYGDRFFSSCAFRWMRIATAFLSAQGMNAELTVIRRDQP